MLPQELTKLRPLVVDGLVVQEMQLLKDIDQVNSFVFAEILFDNSTKLFVEFLYIPCFTLLLRKLWWQFIYLLRSKKPIS